MVSDEDHVSDTVQRDRCISAYLGCFLSIVILVAVLVNFFNRVVEKKNPRNASLMPKWDDNYKLIVDVLLICFIACQWPYYASLLLFAEDRNPFRNWAFSSRCVGAALIHTALALFLKLWIDVLELRVSRGTIIMKIAYTWVVFYWILTIVLIVCVVVDSVNAIIENTGASMSSVYVVYMLSSELTLTLTSMAFLYHAHRLYCKVRSLPSTCNKRRSILGKLMCGILVFMALFALRLAMEIVLLVDTSRDAGYFYPSNVPGAHYGDDHELVWMVTSQYIPEFGLSLLIWYMLRPHSQMRDSDFGTDDETTPPLDSAPHENSISIESDVSDLIDTSASWEINNQLNAYKAAIQAGPLSPLLDQDRRKSSKSSLTSTSGGSLRQIHL